MTWQNLIRCLSNDILYCQYTTLNLILFFNFHNNRPHLFFTPSLFTKMKKDGSNFLAAMGPPPTTKSPSLIGTRVS